MLIGNLIQHSSCSFQVAVTDTNTIARQTQTDPIFTVIFDFFERQASAITLVMDSQTISFSNLKQYKLLC